MALWRLGFRQQETLVTLENWDSCQLMSLRTTRRCSSLEIRLLTWGR